MGGSIPLARTTLLATLSNGEGPVTPPMQKTRNPIARFFCTVILGFSHPRSNAEGIHYFLYLRLRQDRHFLLLTSYF